MVVKVPSGRDLGLRPLFHARLKAECQWSAVETGRVTPGVPDSEYCFDRGVQGWVEFKRASGWRVPTLTANALQIGWIARRARYGGRVWVAVRRVSGIADELYLVNGLYVRELAAGGLLAVERVCWDGGPDAWDWVEIRGVLASKPIFGG